MSNRGDNPLNDVFIKKFQKKFLEKNWYLYNMKLQEQIIRIREMMGSDPTFVNDIDKGDISKSDELINKYGDKITLIEMNNGDVLIKHRDYYNRFILIDNLITKFMDKVFLGITLHREEKEFLRNFLMGTKYEDLPIN
jgi:hypothetical protein